MPVDYPDLVIFDCDGTLVDTERISVRVNLQLLNEVGGDYTEAEVRELFVGASLETYATLVEQRLGKPLEADWIQRWSDMFRGICERELEAVDGVVDALDGIAATGVPLCVASNGMLHDVVRNLGQVGIHDRFDGRIFSATDVAVGKPAPDLFLHAAADFDTAPERCAVIEDSVVGVLAARAAGMTVYAYAGGMTPAERLIGDGTHVFDDMRLLPDLIRDTWATSAAR
ncbi:HAD family hydrolase [Plantibacter sp. PA-3-X8]|uniref:Haloacid dehalogenase superfamily, subfamily IA, variant 3 with third motif having DD or ED n=1 Tax=Plantibacter cousiniae (nom. nud.) TaxID=199709 RepID=A0ABY1LNN1_9MICO|nr:MULTISPECIES: HAD family hydrolase [Plantibacter]AZH81607.1 HAD family hydrolase [Plantibacter sp. PA-3-X8]MBD8517519.1 HAD family hydrolase [Plantibacter sp. CFBP 8804]MBD8535407.1 HAD family hydrolase [Plantibacter sp. CFBP 13570]MDD9153650.1 HAD family hydrolase [Plantibacter flavus]SKC68917.1 haloacid dehalogenase superfamily, subfamily IA, variant 3 with third motif having DD or ED [Plantibacter cousiniae]